MPVRKIDSHYPADATSGNNHASIGLGYFPFARRYLGNRYCFLFLRVLRCFSSPGSLRESVTVSQCQDLTPDGLPHSDIRGSKVMCTSPQLFAAYHVLLRRPVPRHSPYARTFLTCLFICGNGIFYILNLFRRLRAIKMSMNNKSGAKRDRTADLRLARAALSQLSYSPKKKYFPKIMENTILRKKRVHPGREARAP